MCWTGNNIESKPKVAHKDIFVYKALFKYLADAECYKGYLYSPFRGVKYTIGGSYHAAPDTPIKPIKGVNEYCIFMGLHCYSEKCWTVRGLRDSLYIYKPTGGPITSFISNEHKQAVLVKCKIPKGTVYYENHIGEIVTEKLETICEVYYDSIMTVNKNLKRK